MRTLLQISLVFFLMVLSGCSASRRFDRLVKKHPELIRNIQTEITIHDTTIHADTFYYPGFTDSFYIDTSVHDTILIQDKFRIHKKRKNGKDYFNLNVLPDTFYKTDTFYKEIPVIVPGKAIDITPRWVYWLANNGAYILLIILALFGFRNIIRQKANG